jgi:hypothetical protein
MDEPLDNKKLFWVTIEDSGARFLVRPRAAQDGGMVEFFEATSGDFVGSAGINWWNEHALEHVPPRHSYRERPSLLAEGQAPALQDEERLFADPSNTLKGQ